MVPLKSKDGSVLIKDAAEGIMARLQIDLTIHQQLMNGLSQKEMLTMMMIDPTLNEVK